MSDSLFSLLRPRLASLSTWSWLAVALLSIASSPVLRAQGIASNAEEPRAGEEVRGDTKVALINEVERGFFLSLDYGPNYFVPLSGAGFVSLNQDYLSPGTRMGMRLGYDILNNLAVDVFVLANFNQGVISEKALKSGVLTGDLAHFAPGLGLRFAFITTDRVFAYARAGVGYAMWFPAELAGGAFGSIHTDVGLGIEYYTHLRHLSIGVEMNVQSLLLPYAFGVSVYPTIKYTFGSPFDSSDEAAAPAPSDSSAEAAPTN